MLSNKINIANTSTSTNTSKPCHNCRRRRLRCDRSWPSCNKCFVSGQECLGYGKIYVWTQGIDARGKVKLKPAPATSRRAAVCEDDGVAGHHAQRHHHHYQHYYQHQQRQQNRLPDPYQGASNVHGTGQVTNAVAISDVDANANADTSPRIGVKVEVDNGADVPLLAIPSQQQPALDEKYAYPMPGQLTDPIFQDLDQNSRTYLAHFANRVCRDLVARDAPGRNPFRELIPLTQKHPLLLHILVATSALHWANSFSPLLTAAVALSEPGGSGGGSGGDDGLNLARLRSRDLVSRQAVIDALTAKQRAMAHLRNVLNSRPGPPRPSAVSEVTLAAMHFFVKFDLIDIERDDAQSWKAHMAGAGNVLALLMTATASSARPQKDAGSRELRDCVVGDCFIYHILGSTLAPGSCRAAQMTHHALELLPVLKRTEVNSYLSCPAEILQIILSASQQPRDRWATTTATTATATDRADRALALLDEALSFDIEAWATRLQQRTHDATDVESRIHVASAHRSAACLYILQALTPATTTATTTVDSRALVEDILAHLALVGEQDPYFKASSWPTFIAGAEARDADARTWAMTRLLHIWKVCPWGYVLTAMEMLRASWRTQDAAGRAVEGGVNWLEGLQAMGFENMVV